MAGTLCPNSSKIIVTTRMAGMALYAGWGVASLPLTPVGGTSTLFTEDSGGSPAYARQLVTSTVVNAGAIASDGHRMVVSIQSNGSKNITNAGVFDALTSGNLYVIGAFTTAIPVLQNDIIQFTFTVAYA